MWHPEIALYFHDDGIAESAVLAQQRVEKLPRKVLKPPEAAKGKAAPMAVQILFAMANSELPAGT